MQIKWYGHSCFLLTDSNGVRILTDPFSPKTMFELPAIEADAVTVSHDHDDHNYISAVVGSTKLIRTADEFEVGGVKIKGFMTYHDTMKGTLRGTNIMYRFEMDGMKVLHCGDLGEHLDDEAIEKIGKIDILLVPIGAIYTIDDLEARELANRLHARVVIPMHYRNPKLSFELCPLEPFVEAVRHCEVYKMGECLINIMPESLGRDRVIIPRPFNPVADE